MALELVRALAATESDNDFHISRLLLLMKANSARRDSNKSIEGLTKLAKLDFLLRYPNCLERALLASNHSAADANIKEFERTTIESKMVRFRYGPWDYRYRKWVSILAARRLVTVGVTGKTVQIWLTPEGYDVAESIAEDIAYQDLAARAKLVIKRFGAKSGSNLKEFVYETFPELTNMRWGEEIAI